METVEHPATAQSHVSISPILPREFYSRHPVPVARKVLGKMLVRRIDSQLVEGMITETEAYGPPSEDPAVRLEGIRGLRNWEPGLAWTTYLMRGRATLNVTTETPSCVLIRAIEPTLGWEAQPNPNCSTVGPINLPKALMIGSPLDGVDVTENGSLYICQGQDIPADKIQATKRKNLKVDTEEPRRFYIKGSRFVS